jgi:hypothetical protein
MIPEKRFYCHKCQQEIVFEVKMARTDLCPHCGVDMHCCKNCEHWDPSAHNQCKEHIAEYIPDREHMNYCTYFTFRAGERGVDQSASAKAKLESLFKKK